MLALLASVLLAGIDSDPAVNEYRVLSRNISIPEMYGPPHPNILTPPEILGPL